MKQNKKDLDAILEHAARAVRDEQADPAVIDQAAERVWAMVGQVASEANPSTVFTFEGTEIMKSYNDQISGCDDFRSLIPDLLSGKLSAARTLLLEDHSNECIPCRKAIKEARTLSNAKSATYIPRTHAQSAAKFSANAGLNRSRTAKFSRIGIAAAVVVCIGLVGMFMYERLDLSGRTLAATLENVDGQVFVVSDAVSRPLAAGEQLQKGELVRTAKDSNALLRLADGSTVEMRERSEFSVSENMRGVTIKLDRGDVIVEAAKQHNGRLYVQTPDSIVSVKGTIFAVESGTKGSRVSVVEGEVKVDHANKEETLLPGDQTTTNSSLERSPVEKSVAWSRNAAKYSNLVSELAKLRREVNQRVQRQGVRYSSRFVDLVPENTVFYAALPNFSESLAESQKVMQERIKQNPALAEWSKSGKGSGVGLDDETLSRIREFGSQLGDEIVVSASMDAKGEPSGVLVLSTVKDAANFRNYLGQEAARLTKEAGKTLNIKLVDDPNNAALVTPLTTEPSKNAGGTRVGERSELYVWINNDIFAASPKIETLRELAETLKAPDANRFVTSSFHQRINDVYRDGAGLVVAADLEKIIAQAISKDQTPEAGRHLEGLKLLGITNLRHFIVEQKEMNGKTLSRAALTFNEPGRGIPSWLAAPGPMGALDYISPNANIVAAFVVKEPTLLVDDLLSFMETVDPEIRTKLADVEKQQGFSIRNDIAAPLGGEFAFAVDGPILPTPSWKMVMEVYDQPKLQNTFERAIEKLNQFSIIHGKGKLVLESTNDGGRTFYSIRSADTGIEMHYTYANGYLIAAPNRALLEQSLANRDAGNTLVRSSRFMSSLPQDGNTNFSAIFYHDLAPIVSSLAAKMKNVGGEAANEKIKAIGAFDVNVAPTLAYVYAQGDRITLSANTEGGAFGLNPASLIGLPNSFEMQNILMNAMGEKDVKTKSE